MNWRWISIAVALAGLVIGYGAFMQRDTADMQGEQDPATQGYYLKDAIITVAQDDGSPGIRFVANRIEQNPADNSIAMSAVRIDYYKVHDRRWVLTADRGFVPTNSRTVELSGQVELHPFDRAGEVFLRTDALAIDTIKNVAYATSSPVHIQYGKLYMTARGFEADLRTEIVRLESVDAILERG